jgi:hypothetical protein
MVWEGFDEKTNVVDSMQVLSIAAGDCDALGGEYRAPAFGCSAVCLVWEGVMGKVEAKGKLFVGMASGVQVEVLAPVKFEVHRTIAITLKCIDDCSGVITEAVDAFRRLHNAMEMGKLGRGRIF